MRNSKSILSAVAVASVIFGVGAASAADLPARTYTKAPVMVDQIYNWTGFYIGGFVGGAFADRNAVSTDPTFAGGTFYNGPLSNSYGLSSSVIAGGTVGYNYQPVGTKWVFGVEGEAGYIHLGRTIQDINAINDGFAFPDSLDTTRFGDWYGVIAGRLGFTADRALFYGKAGVAFVNKNYSFIDACNTGGCGLGLANITRNQTQVTWAAGAGIEYALSNNWSVKGEYLYLATQQTFTATGTVIPATPVSNVHTDPGIHTAKFGVNYRFGGPVVASY
jgi:outer membrane immunogenic protein